MANRSPLDDPYTAAHAWARYRWLMRWMGLATLVVIVAVDAWLYAGLGLVSIHLYIATSLGVGITMMLMAALMGLVFLSSGTGHDESIEDRLDSSHWDDT
ncbi:MULTISPECIES: hypothetical protein [unclassified Novosphingobium]|uniref:hypothetical protein n=1 Tax=Novosphingobium TaxID=165696 RepID=UPI001445B491|nr:MULTISPECIES: hypothetical protein [unclassified Novosphingobium]NKJ42641.1 hypothetical protein [Novosphingobium sp. SG720]NMN05718.1 hypothetical protein [Novosphingobium sp. SG919]NMN87922.1 hypothetical protein [Novosphingobium sp. SG916]